MGLRFRKSINIGNGFRINFNKKSVGLSVGTKGARYTIYSEGRKTSSIGIPGTGLYWTETKTGNNKDSNRKSNILGCLVWILFLPFLLIYYIFKFIINGIKKLI